MVKLTSLNNPILTIQGIGIADLQGDRKITYKSGLIAICEMHQPQKPGTGEALKAFDLGIRIQKAEKEIELKEEDIKFLKEIINNSTIYLSVIIGRLIHYLNEALPKVEEPEKK